MHSSVQPQLLGAEQILTVLATHFQQGDFTPQRQAAWQKLTDDMANALAHKYH